MFNGKAGRCRQSDYNGYLFCTYVKILLKGSEPGLWTLISHNASAITDVPLAWAARVKWVQKR